ncbi:hypothetical protein NM688_g6292 [Phlebia brevispora]|uniref:Uncharacterized protein n=1 Tax=Phlebia brevispora TaxID=194682 RepID=A0ACC1SHR9_9APHY|nr:hypothetical protein NM688_g6292 [Phlebia brevispora]
MHPTSVAVDPEVVAAVAAGQPDQLTPSLQVVAGLPWLAIVAQYIRIFFHHLIIHGRAFVFRVFMTIFLFNIPSTSCIVNTVSLLKTADEAAILVELGQKGRFTFIWLKMVVSCLTLLTILVELLQIPRFSEGSLATLLLICAIILAFNSLMTSIVFCCYAYTATLERHATSWKQVAADVGESALSTIVSLPLTNFLWSMLLLCISFAASYACLPVVCLRINDGLSHMTTTGPSLLAAGVLICYALHITAVAYVLKRYHANLDMQPESQELDTLSTNV